MHDLLRDVRISVRSLARQPGFAIVAVLTIALGVGANTAMFSVVNGVLLRPLAVQDAERVVALREVDRDRGEAGAVSVANFMDWQAAATSFSAMAVAEPYGFDYIGADGPASVDSWRVTEEFFDVLRQPALLGRTLRAADFEGGRNVAVIGHGVWRERFGGDPAVVGSTLPSEDGPVEIVGVMPPGFEYPRGRSVWTPVRYDPELAQRARASSFLQAVARLAPAVTLEEAEAELAAISERIAAANPSAAGLGAAVEPLHRHLVGGARPALMILLGAVGLLLLLASANVANLVLARGTRRSGELAIRSALGAGRRALVRQSLTESLVLGAAGGMAGILVAFWTQDLILAFAPADIPRIDQVSIDGTVLVFATGAALLTTTLFGLFPAVRYARSDARGAFRSAGRGGTGSTRERVARDGLAVLQVALALVLLIGAALVVRSFTSVMAVDRGYRTDNVLASSVQAWGYFPSPADRESFVRDATDRLAALPGVHAAGVTSSLPLAEPIGNDQAAVQVAGRPVPAAEWPAVRAAAVTPGFFQALRIPLRQGRMLGPADHADAAPVVLVNERFARDHFRGEDPVGQRLEVRFSGPPRTLAVVGVVGDVRDRRLEDLPTSAIYIPHAQAPTGALTFVVRTAGDAAAWADPVQRTIWEFNDRMPIDETTTLDALLRGSMAERRFHLFLLGSFSGLGLLLAAIGVYGVLSYATRQRVREIGIRMAVGASSREVLLEVAGKGVALVGVGLGIGLLLAIPASHALRSLLYGVEPTDPLTYAVAMALLTVVGVAAALVPAFAATRIDPMNVLKTE